MTRLLNLSVPEVSHIRKKQRNPALVAAVYGIIVPDAPTWLCNHTNPSFTCLFHCIIPSCSRTSGQSISTDISNYWLLIHLYLEMKIIISCIINFLTLLNLNCNDYWEQLPNGKKASLAKAAPLTSSPAFFKAILKLSSRFGCPLPMPSIQLFCPKWWYG